MNTPRIAGASAALLALGGMGYALAAQAPAATSRTGTDITPYTAKTITLNKPTLPPKPLDFYLRTWQLGVPGAAYVTPGPVGSGTAIHHVSLGTAASHRLTVRADHSWAWNGDSGRWTSTGRKDYPILLVDAYQGADWYVGYDQHTDGRIFVWNKKASWWLYGRP